jgi:poly(A) polymerase
MGAIKEVVFEDPDLPEDRDDALEKLEGVKAEVLSGADRDGGEANS